MRYVTIWVAHSLTGQCAHTACVSLTFIVCEGGPVLLAVFHLLHHYQASPLHVHRQRVLLTLSDLCQLCQVNIQLYLKRSNGRGFNTNKETRCYVGLLNVMCFQFAFKSDQIFTPPGVSKVKVSRL